MLCAELLEAGDLGGDRTEEVLAALTDLLDLLLAEKLLCA